MTRNKPGHGETAENPKDSIVRKVQELLYQVGRQEWHTELGQRRVRNVRIILERLSWTRPADPAYAANNDLELAHQILRALPLKVVREEWVRLQGEIEKGNSAQWEIDAAETLKAILRQLESLEGMFGAPPERDGDLPQGSAPTSDEILRAMDGTVREIRRTAGLEGDHPALPESRAAL